MDEQWSDESNDKQHDKSEFTLDEHERDEKDEESGDDQSWGKWGKEMPEWATFERDVTVWWSILNFWHVDDDAREALFALAQHSDQGYQAANELIGKLLKKRPTTKLSITVPVHLYLAVC